MSDRVTIEIDCDARTINLAPDGILDDGRDRFRAEAVRRAWMVGTILLHAGAELMMMTTDELQQISLGAMTGDWNGQHRN